MVEYICDICKKSSSRKWNLTRHIQEVHKIKNCNTHNSKSEITNCPNDEYSNSNIFSKNNIEDNINNQNSYSRNNYYENF